MPPESDGKQTRWYATTHPCYHKVALDIIDSMRSVTIYPDVYEETRIGASTKETRVGASTKETRIGAFDAETRVGALNMRCLLI
jgi:hypothetical protein